MNQPAFPTRMIAAEPDAIAPDGSEIRFLPQLAGGSMVHCRLPVGATTLAVVHRTVEELWYVLAGQGELWRSQDGEAAVASLIEGVAATIPLGAHFQFRNVGDVPLEILIVTMPPWPGADEAERVPDHWPPS